MIVHLVVFQLIQNNTAAIERFRSELSKLEHLKYTIDFKIVQKVDFIKDDLNGDLTLYATFDNETDLQSYMNDSVHIKTIEATKPNIKKKVVVDFKV